MEGEQEVELSVDYHTEQLTTPCLIINTFSDPPLSLPNPLSLPVFTSRSSSVITSSLHFTHSFNLSFKVFLAYLLIFL